MSNRSGLPWPVAAVLVIVDDADDSGLQLVNAPTMQARDFFGDRRSATETKTQFYPQRKASSETQKRNTSKETSPSPMHCSVEVLQQATKCQILVT